LARRAAVVTAACGLAGGVVLVAASSAGAASSRSTYPYKNGTINCTDVSGAITFSPALKASTHTSVSVTFSVTSKSCLAHKNTGAKATQAATLTWTSKENGASVSLPVINTELKGSSFTKDGFALGGSPKIAGLSGVSGTSFAFSSLEVGQASQKDLTLTYPGKTGYGSVNGAFQGTDAGYSSSGRLVLGLSLAEITKEYGNAHGLKQIEIIGGRLTLK